MTESSSIVKMNFHLVDQCVIIVTFTPKGLPKVCFPSYLKTSISATEVHILSLFPVSFQHFSLNFQESCLVIRQKGVMGNSYVLLLSEEEVMTILVKRMGVLSQLKV